MKFDYESDAGGFRVVVAGEERVLPELAGDDLSRWHARYARAYLNLLGAAASSESIDDFLQANEVGIDDMLDALMAYDRTGALWSRDWIEDHMTDSQLLLVLRRIQHAHA